MKQLTTEQQRVLFNVLMDFMETELQRLVHEDSAVELYNAIMKDDEEKSLVDDEIIAECLKKLGMPKHIKGYGQVKRAILLLLEDREKFSSITKVLYTEIAEEMGTTPSRIERNIRQAIGVTFQRGDDSYIEKIFGNTISPERGVPSNKEFLITIADYLSS